MTQRIFVDANILASRTLLDWLFHFCCANPRMFQLHSTEDVFVEAAHTMRKRYPRAGGGLIANRVEKIRAVIDEVLPDFPSEGPFTGRDVGDYHVHAAAVASHADFIPTNNDPTDITRTPEEEPYEVISADAFFLLVITSNPRCFKPVTRGQLEYWGNRGRGQLDDALRRAGCEDFAQHVRRMLQHIALEER